MPAPDMLHLALDALVDEMATNNMHFGSLTLHDPEANGRMMAKLAVYIPPVVETTIQVDWDAELKQLKPREGEPPPGDLPTYGVFE